MFDCQIVFGQNFAILKLQYYIYNIIFFVKSLVIEPCSSFAITLIFLLHVKNSQLLKSIWNRIRSLRYISMSLFLMRPATENHEIVHQRKFWTTKKNLGPTKYPREKMCYLQNTHKEKFRTHEIPKRKYFELTKYSREKILDPRNLAHSQKLLHHYQHSKNELNS